MTDLTALHLDQIAKAAAKKREMICFRADGTEIERRNVPAMARFSMQAASDHKHADRAKAELGAILNRVSFGNTVLYFDTKGRSYFKF